MDIDTPAPLRRWLHPVPGDSWDAIAQRALPELPVKQAIAKLQSWNMHLVFRPPPATLTCSDVLFIEPPAVAA